MDYSLFPYWISCGYRDILYKKGKTLQLRYPNTIFPNFLQLTSWNKHITGKKTRSRIKQRNETTKKAKK
jgi:hypothetical protein